MCFLYSFGVAGCGVCTLAKLSGAASIDFEGRFSNLSRIRGLSFDVMYM